MLYVYLAFGKLLAGSDTWPFCYNSLDQDSIEAH